MHTVFLMIDAAGLVLGSLIIAVLLCWGLWQAGVAIRHPDWAAFAIAAVALFGLGGGLPESPLLDMVLVFAGVAAIPLWLMGREWRQQPNSIRRSQPAG